MDDRSPLPEQFRRHFGHRDHLYGVLLDELADDLDAGGPTAEICADHLLPRRSDAIQLRLLAGVFRIVLRGEAPELAPYYPSLGGAADPEEAWPVVRRVLVAHVDELRRALRAAPQTNEVGRSVGLAIGLFEAVRAHGVRRVRLLEPGASAGLNLNVDRVRITGPGWDWGTWGSPLTLDSLASGVRPEPVQVVERRGCDLSPVDVSKPAGAEYLTSFVWPFDLARHARLAAAIEIARRHPVTVDEAPASTWIRAQLARPADPDVLTVVWHSMTAQYWPVAEREAVTAAIVEARVRMPLSHVTMEGVPPPQSTDGYPIDRQGPEIRVDGDLIARSHHHGPPVVMA